MTTPSAHDALFALMGEHLAELLDDPDRAQRSYKIALGILSESLEMMRTRPEASHPKAGSIVADRINAMLDALALMTLGLGRLNDLAEGPPQ